MVQSDQTPIIMNKLPPGDLSSIYFILIQNIHGRCTKLQLEAYTRTDPQGKNITVEGAEVFPESHSGWVAVRGKDGFQTAMSILPTPLQMTTILRYRRTLRWSILVQEPLGRRREERKRMDLCARSTRQSIISSSITSAFSSINL
jgi:hypothetical protein